MKKKNRWESAQERYSRMKQDKKTTWSWIREASVAEEEETKPGAIPVGALQMAIQIQLRLHGLGWIWIL